MARKLFSEQIKQAIRQSGMSGYAIWKACGVDEGNLSKFLAGKSGLSLKALDRIADVIGLQAILKPKKTKVVNRGQRMQ